MVNTRAQHLKKLQAKAQQRITESWDTIEGSQDLFFNILSRVSVKSIPKFKAVSKHWHSSISNKYFLKQQITHSSKNLLFISCPVMDLNMKLYSMKAGRFELSVLNTIHPSNISHEESLYMIASFNGLICCVNQIFYEGVESRFCDLQIWICNPCTGETFLLPQGTPSFEFEPSVGVAYGSDISEYRVFRIFGKKRPEEEEDELFGRNNYVLACEVYSSNTGSWKKIVGIVPSAPMCGFGPYRCGHVFVGNKIYWLVSLDEPGEILSVDLEGNFDIFKLPRYPKHLPYEEKITEGTHLFILRESLALLVLHVGSMDIWIRKQDGEKCRWVRVRVTKMPIKYDEIVIAVTSLKNQMLLLTETHWHTYDVDTKIWGKGRAPRTGFLNPAVFPFTESVLPCNGGVRL